MSVELEVMESTFPVSDKGIIAEAKRVIEKLLYAGHEEKDEAIQEDAESAAHAFLLELSHAATTPPRPLQPGDKVLVECYYEASHAPGRGRVRFHAPVYQGHRMVSGDIVMGVPLSAIRPFPQEEV